MAEVAAPAIARQRKIDSGEIGQEVLREQEDFANDRAPWEPSWQDITERILPNYADFTSKSSPGQRRTDKIYDGTGPLALERFQAAMESYLAPRTQTWHKGRCGVRQVADEKDVKVWADEVSKTLIDYRYNPRSGFAIGLPEIFTGLGALGTACLFTELDRAGGGPRYRSIPLVEIFISNGKDGRCDKLHRRFEYTARQAAQAWGEDNLPDKIRAQLSDKPETKSEYVHCVKPRGDYRPFSRRAADAPFLSTYVSVDAKQAIGQGGFFEFPYHVSRYTTSPREKYGRSPAFLVLSDIKMVNEMSRDQIRILNRLADPPLLVFDEIGSRQDATAAALQMLVNAGLITPDPRLESFVRTAAGLPGVDPEADAADPVPEPPQLTDAGKAAARVFVRAHSRRAKGDPKPQQETLFDE